MPYMQAMVLRATDVFAQLDDFNPEALLEAIGDAETILEGAELLGLFDVLSGPQADGLREFLELMPPSLDAALVAGLRSALQRGLRTQFTWQPGYDFELRAWEVSSGSDGVVNFHIVSPHPDEPVET